MALLPVAVLYMIINETCSVKCSTKRDEAD